MCSTQPPQQPQLALLKTPTLVASWANADEDPDCRRRAKDGRLPAQGLLEAGFVVDLARDGVDGLHLALTGDYDLIVLDVMLPRWTAGRCSENGAPDGEMPVLFLTARDQVEDRVKGLELGADDYLVKPFAFSELLARVRTLLRAANRKEAELLRAADLELDLLRRRVTRAAHASISPPRNSPCSNCCCAVRARCCRAP
jgi:DNA-binding response OmpR family regulator